MLASVVAHVYARVAPRLVRWVPPCRRVHDEIVALVGPTPARVLDLALGPGDLALALAEAGHVVVGIEANGVIRRAAARRAIGCPNVQVADHPVARGSFDVVVSLHALYADRAWCDTLHRARCALRPGGRAIFVNFAAPFPLRATLRAVARRDGIRAAMTAALWLVLNLIFEWFRRPRTASHWPQPVFEARVNGAGFSITEVRRTFLNDGSVLIVARAAEAA
jgi:SAM-dependent methyltransferase